MYANFFAQCFAGLNLREFSKSLFCVWNSLFSNDFNVSVVVLIFIHLVIISPPQSAGLNQEVPSRPDSMKALDELANSRKDGSADSNLRKASDVAALCERGDSAACVALGLMKFEVQGPNSINIHHMES